MATIQGIYIALFGRPADPAWPAPIGWSGFSLNA